MDELVKRLRAEAREVHPFSVGLAKAATEAAAQIERLRDEVEQGLRAESTLRGQIRLLHSGGADAIARAEAAERFNGELREALTKARKAIASLDEDGLGWGQVAFATPDSRCAVYPLRDELLAELDAVLDSKEKG